MQKPDMCMLCKSEGGSSELVMSYMETGWAHIQCVEEKVCVYCGVPGMCQKCFNKDCVRTYHEHCFRKYFDHFEKNLYCDLHRKVKGKKKESQRLWHTRQVAGRVNEELEIIRKIKEKHNDSKFHSICSGQVFWYFIGAQYFPKCGAVVRPEILVRGRIEYTENWGKGLGEYLETLELEHSRVKAANDLVLAEYSIPLPAPIQNTKDYKEEDLILCETRNLMLKDGFETYLRYFESKMKEDTDTSSSTEKRTSSLREVPKNEEDFVCAICGDGDYEDDDLIVICSVCEIGAHMKCYGIPVVPVEDWICHGCKIYPSKELRSNINCALCPIKGGCVKPTIHRAQGQASFPNYLENSGEQVWVHIFCAFHLEPKVFKDQEYLDEIDLNVIDSKRFSLKCCVCKTKDGACLQCQYGRCQTAFHPECAKDFFTNTRDKTGYEEVSYYCPMHKPLKLRRILEGKEKKAVEDIVAFCKSFEKLEKKVKNPVVPCVTKRIAKAERPFSYDEKFKLIEVLENELEKIKRNCVKEFSIVFKNKSGSLRNRIETIRPEAFNLVDPQFIITQKVAIKGRKTAECFKYYQEFLYPLMKKELEVQQLAAVVYCPKTGRKNKLNKKKKENRGRKRKEVRDQDKRLFVSDAGNCLLEDVVTEEVYCICRKPFVERSARKLWESEQDFAKRTEESQMVQCDRCEEWYHYKCIGITSANIPESYTCQACILKVAESN